MWINGPFGAGSDADLTIFRANFRKKLMKDELMIADSAFLDVKCTYEGVQGNTTARRFRARHETVFARFKSFGVLRCRFRHGIEKHMTRFFAVANIVQIQLCGNHPLFEL